MRSQTRGASAMVRWYSTAMRSIVIFVVLLAGTVSANPKPSAKMDPAVPLPAHAKVVSVEDGRAIKASYWWKAVLAVDCKAKPIVVEIARLAKASTAKITAVDAVVSLYAAQLRAAKRAVSTGPEAHLSFDVPPSGAAFAERTTTSDACGAQLEISVGPAGG